MTMARILSFLPVVALAAEPSAEVKLGERLPELRGEFLTGRKVVLPQVAQGRVTLLLLGFTYQSRFAVEGWAEKFRAQFRSDPRVMFYEVPMIGGVVRLAKWFIDSGMRRGTPEEDYVQNATEANKSLSRRDSETCFRYRSRARFRTINNRQQTAKTSAAMAASAIRAGCIGCIKPSNHQQHHACCPSPC